MFLHITDIIISKTFFLKKFIGRFCKTSMYYKHIFKKPEKVDNTQVVFQKEAQYLGVVKSLKYGYKNTISFKTDFIFKYTKFFTNDGFVTTEKNVILK
jgi:hypothetical protein